MAYSRALQSHVIGSVSSNPDVLYFEADTSATRMAGADVRYQPITGDGDANSIKEWENVTYLFLFRKHEQGKNAQEVAAFDPLVAAAEKEIAELKKPKPVVIEFAPAK